MNDILKIHTFGGLVIQGVDEAVSGFVSRKAEALFVYLACNPREHPRELLAELLWDDLSQARASGNLRTVLSSLQNQLSPYILATRQTISINPEANLWVDANTLDIELNKLTHQATLSGSLSRMAAAKLEQTLALFKGDFLAGFNVRESSGFEGWQTLERERLRGRVIEAQSKLVDYYIDTHQYSLGIVQATQLLQLDTLWENTHRQLMLLYARLGQRKAALAQYETCVKLLDDELGVKPDEKTSTLYVHIQRGTIAAATEIKLPPHNLSVPSTPFVDRPAELTQIAESLHDPACRLLTVLGLGGSGKTRLALQVAALELSNYHDGVFQVNLAAVQSADHVVSAITDVLKLDPNSKTDGKTQLFNYLEKRQILLVLDNIEHLLDSTDLLIEILTHAPDIKLLITSRERLNIREEWVVSVAGMTFPTHHNEIDANRYSALQLFIQSARRASPAFVFKDHVPAVAHICQLVEGMPLGIELAVSWLRVMPVAQIEDEILHNLDILQTSLRNVPERHRSLRATFEVSWFLLNETERRLLQHLSVFRGRFQQAAARLIAQASALTLLTLCDKSLLSIDDGHYKVHELIRQFAAEKLSANPQEEAQIRAAHSVYYADFLIACENHLNSDSLVHAIQDITEEIDNVHAAWEYALAHRDLPLLGKFLKPFYYYYDVHCHYNEGAEMFRQLAAVLADAAEASNATPSQARMVQARGCILQASMFVCMSRYKEAQPLINQNLSVVQVQNLPWETRIGLASLGTIHYAQGQYADSWSFYEQALPYYQSDGAVNDVITILIRLGDIATVLGEYDKARQLLFDNLPILGTVTGKRSKLLFLTTLGDLEYKLGDYGLANQHFSESRALSVEVNDRTSLAVALVSLGRTTYGLGNYAESIQLCMDSIAICTETHNQWGKSFALAHLGRAYHASGDRQTALQHYWTALAICQEMGNRWVMSFTLRQMSRTTLVLGDLNEAQHSALRAVEIAVDIQAKPLVMDALMAVAQVMQSTEQKDEALVLAQFVSRESSTEYETRQEALQLCANIQPNMAEGLNPSFTLDVIIQRALTLRSIGLNQ